MSERDGARQSDEAETLRALDESAVESDEAGDVVVVEGREARVFLHRLSTQDVASRSGVSGALNTFLDKRGRLQFMAHHATMSDERVVLVVEQGAAAALVGWLEGFHFAEDVVLRDESAVHHVRLVMGKDAPRIVDGVVPGAGGLARFDARGDDETLIVRTFDRVAPRAGRVPAFLVVEKFGRVRSLRIPLCDAATSEAARIAAMVPVRGREVTDAVNPLELALSSAIHWDKGCYTGQEVISRTENRGKQARYLVGLVSDDAIAVGDEVMEGESVLGIVTSAASSPVAHAPRALAILRTQSDLDGQEVRVRGKAGDRAARVVRAAH